MINLNIDNIVVLKSKKHPVQDTLFRPAVSAHVDAIPTTKFFGQSAPFATMLRDIKYGVKHLQVRDLHVAARNGQQRLDKFVLLRCDFHAAIIQQLV